MRPAKETTREAMPKPKPDRLNILALIHLFHFLDWPRLLSLHKSNLLSISTTPRNQPLDLIADSKYPMIPLRTTSRFEHDTATRDAQLADSHELTTVLSTTALCLLLRILDIIARLRAAEP